MGDEKVNLTTENADYSDFKVINVEETVTTGVLTFHDCEGRIMKKDVEKKAMQEAIDEFRKEAPKALRVIASTINASTQEVRRNIRILQSPDSDDEKKKKIIRQIKDAEITLEKSEKIKTNWCKIADLTTEILLEVNEENYVNEWRFSEKEIR